MPKLTESPDHPAKLGDLVEFDYPTGPRRGYVTRLYRSSHRPGAMQVAVTKLHRDDRGREHYVEKSEILRVIPEIRRHDQPRLI